MSILADAPPSSSQFCDWSLSLREIKKCKPAIIAKFVPLTDRGAVFAELSEVGFECSTPNWNGYKSDPIGLEARNAAERFLHSLPHDIPDPTVSALAEGLFSFEWYFSPEKVVVVVPHTKNGLDFVVREGTEVTPGSVPFFGNGLPSEVVTHIRRLK